VPPPQITGDLKFERVLRVQQNTRAVGLLPAPVVVVLFLRQSIMGCWCGAFWLVGRIVYAWGYYQAEKRTIGFGISSISGMVLLLGSLFGIILSLVRPEN